MKLPKLNEIVFDKKKILLICITFAAVLYADLALLMRWQIEMIKASKPEIAQLKASIETLHTDIARMEQEKQKQIMERKLSREKPRKIPSAAMIPKVFSTIADLANKNSIKIMQISTVKAKGTPAPEPYPAVYVSADLLGEYHNFGAFLNDLDDMDEVVSVTDFKITPSPDKAQTQFITTSLKIYVEK